MTGVASKVANIDGLLVVFEAPVVFDVNDRGVVVAQLTQLAGQQRVLIVDKSPSSPARIPSNRKSDYVTSPEALEYLLERLCAGRNVSSLSISSGRGMSPRNMGWEYVRLGALDHTLGEEQQDVAYLVCQKD